MNLDIPFRRRLTPILLQQWNVNKNAAFAVPLSSVGDEISWSLNHNGKFSTASVYHHLERSITGPDNKIIWKAKLPLKIKVFLWQLFQDAILVRENTMKRKWLGCPVSSFCNNIETVGHLFFTCASVKVVWGILGACLETNTCPQNICQSLVWFYKFLPNNRKFYTLLLAAIAWSIWTIRDKITFENYRMRSPEVIVYTVASFMGHWGGLYDEGDVVKIRDGVKKLMEKTTDIMQGILDGGAESNDVDN